jgi:N-hydroxyarylamine O-acetyltransferase
VDQNIERIFDKIVHRQRGGWCYEMNGLLCWALREIGFEVMRMTGGVMRKERGDEAMGNHLVLCVELDGPYIADAGLGDGLAEPIPLRSGTFTQGHREFRLEPLGDNLWRFNNSPGATPPSFDVRHAPADEELLAQTCETLQSDPESMFRQNLICFRAHAAGSTMLLGRLLVDSTAEGTTRTLLYSAQELVDTLTRVFGLRDAGNADLWPQVVSRHEALFGDADAEAIRLDGG